MACYRKYATDFSVFQVLTECKETAAKRRRQSTRLENLGIPEEELLRQQQELFARARESALQQERQMLEASNGVTGEHGEAAEVRDGETEEGAEEESGSGGETES